MKFSPQSHPLRLIMYFSWTRSFRPVIWLSLHPFWDFCCLQTIWNILQNERKRLKKLYQFIQLTSHRHFRRTISSGFFTVPLDWPLSCSQELVCNFDTRLEGKCADDAAESSMSIKFPKTSEKSSTSVSNEWEVWCQEVGSWLAEDSRKSKLFSFPEDCPFSLSPLATLKFQGTWLFMLVQ